MPESKNDLIIKFSGRLDNLVIKYKGKVILNYKESPESQAEIADGYVKNHNRLGVTSSFAKAVYTIPILRRIWHKSYFKKSPRTRFKVAPQQRIKPGKAIAFNKIVAANNKFSGSEYPTKHNIIVPVSHGSFIISKAILHNKGIDISIPGKQQYFIEMEAGVTMTAAAVICVYNPIKNVKKKFELIPKSYLVCDFDFAEDNDFRFSFEPEEEERILNYKNLILYYSLISTDQRNKIVHWTHMNPLEMEIKTREEGVK